MGRLRAVVTIGECSAGSCKVWPVPFEEQARLLTTFTPGKADVKTSFFGLLPTRWTELITNISFASIVFLLFSATAEVDAADWSTHWRTGRCFIRFSQRVRREKGPTKKEMKLDKTEEQVDNTHGKDNLGAPWILAHSCSR